MSDLTWLQHVERFLREQGLDVEVALSRLRQSQWYTLARGQFLTGLRGRDLARLLERAVQECGLSDARTVDGA